MQKILFMLALLLLPSTVFGAGFAKQSLFLSKTPVTEGESVLIHSVVQNEGASKFEGSLIVFAQQGSNEKTKIGTVAVSIAPQGANTVSVSWSPKAGEYTVSAELTTKDGTIAETQTAHVTIDKKASPENDFISQIDTQVQSSADVQAMIAKFSPTVAGFIKPGFLAIDTFRIKSGELLDQGLNWSKSKVGKNTNPGSVLGVASEQGTSPQGLVGTASYLAAMVALYFFSILKWLIGNAAVFYPFVAIAFLYALWRLFARMRRPSY